MTFYGSLVLVGAALTTAAASAAPPPPGASRDDQSAASNQPRAPMPQAPGAGSGGQTPGGGQSPEADWGNAGGVTPGFLDVGRTQATDKTYGPTSRGGMDASQLGFTVMPIEVYGEGEDIGPTLPTTFPEFHTVNTGDTLWGISNRYYGDPYQWPKLWAHNGQITNANWIFPGDQIRLRDPHAQTVAFAEPTAGPVSSLHFGTSVVPRPQLLPQYVVNRYAFVDERDYNSSMEVTGGAQAKVMMAMLDTAYVGYPAKTPPVAGERLAVYEIARPIYDIKTSPTGAVNRGKRIGYLVEVVGEVHVNTVAPKSAEVRVVDSIKPIERGMKVGELRHRFARVRPQGSLVSARGRIVDSIGQDVINGEQQFVIVNMGQKDGVTRGNVLDVVRRGDEYMTRDLMGVPNEDGHPRRVLGELLVLEVKENVAITLAINSTQELMVGDYVEIGKTAP